MTRKPKKNNQDEEAHNLDVKEHEENHDEEFHEEK